jgi:hypothetical protein
MPHTTPTIPTIPEYDEDENEECIRPMDWLFATDFILRRFLRVN